MDLYNGQTSKYEIEWSVYKEASKFNNYVCFVRTIFLSVKLPKIQHNKTEVQR